MQEIDENVQIFISEAVELLEEIENSLLELENASDDDELLNLVFRAAHTIKGSAGLFGFEHIIEFTHVVENTLDDMRNCIIPISSELITVLMRSKDQIAALVEALPEEESINTEEEKELVDLLNAFRSGKSAACAAESNNDETEAEAEATETSGENASLQLEEVTTEAESSDSIQSEHYHISLRLGVDTFREGFIPNALFKQLATIGEIKSAVLVDENMPVLSELDPESCYLGWEIALDSQASKDEIHAIFEFVEGAQCTILPPSSKISEYRHLIQHIPEDEYLALGQILLQTGTLTEEELQLVLNKQQQTQEKVGDLLVENKIVQSEVVEQALEKQQKQKVNQQKALSFVKVDSAKLDKLVNLVGELVINGAKMEQLSDRYSDDVLHETMESTISTLEELRETALALRMIPIGATFNRFHRVVRDISQELEKDIRLEIYGADSELDKTVIDKISDPLMHLVRNSLDHGIEMPDEREQLGKSRQGVIKLDAHHEAGMIVIQITDDGAGMDADKLVEKAIEKGVISSGQKLKRGEIFNLIFEPGFSMAKQISNISGRGVGMDVVRRNIEALRGTILITSELGKGTTITIQLPLTLSIIDGFHIKVDQEDFIIPLDMIKECITLNETQIQESSMHDYITLRGEVLPLIELRSYYSLSGDYGDDSENHLKHRENIVVVQFGQQKVGLVVGDLLGEIQAVIKPLGRVFKGLNGFAGFTILGSGHIALVIDVPGLVKDVVTNEKTQFDKIKKDQIDTSRRLLH
ncbi:MAG: chemotaxis protein CheA [Gammaproteobacteria bacterium]|nr:chemotaxis protein CheA [Gammaproteobacteria bacterium]